MLPLVGYYIRTSWCVGAKAIAQQMKSLTDILPKPWILDMAFEFQDHLGIYGPSWRYLIANTFVFSGAVRHTQSKKSTYLACYISQSTT